MAWTLFLFVTLVAVGSTRVDATGASCWLPGPSITISEGDAQTLQIAVNCSEQINPSDCSFDLSSYPITASQYDDYFTFATTEGGKPALDINIVDNPAVEDDERFAVELMSVTCQGIPDVNVTIPMTTVIIVDDDVVTCSLGIAPTVWETPVATRIPVQCDNEVDVDGFMLEIAYVDGTAVAPSDYIQTPTMVPIPTSTTSFSFDVPIVNDDLPELPEYFEVRLAAVLVPSSFTRTSAARSLLYTVAVVIYDADLSCSLDAANVTVKEGSDSSAKIPVECNSEVSDYGFFLAIEYLDVTAVASSDYLGIETRIPIPISTRTFSFDVPIVNDNNLEEAETFTVRCYWILIKTGLGDASIPIPETVTTVSIYDDDGEATTLPAARECYLCLGEEECAVPLGEMNTTVCGEIGICAYVNVVANSQNGVIKDVYRDCALRVWGTVGCISATSYVDNYSGAFVPNVRESITGENGTACFCEEHLCNGDITPVIPTEPATTEIDPSGFMCYACIGTDCEMPVDELAIVSCGPGFTCVFLNATADLGPENGLVNNLFRDCIPSQFGIDGCFAVEDYVDVVSQQVPGLADLIQGATGTACFCQEDICNVELTPPVEVIDPCEANNCSNGATCVPAGQGFTCSCPPGFEGSICGDIIDPCEANNCSNGATCVPAGQSFTCSCPPGFEGPICGDIIDPCESDDCLNGATCVPAGQSFTCSCLPGFEGLKCGDTIPNDDLHNRLMNLSELLFVGNVSTEDIQEAAELVEDASGQDAFLKEAPANVDIVVDSLELITGAGDAMVTKPVIRIVNNLMNLDPNALVDSTSGGGRVVAALEEQISNVQASEGNFSASLENLEVAAVKIDRNNIASSLSFASLTPLNSTPSDNSSSAAEANTRLYGDDVPVNRTAVAITIPADVLDLFIREDEDPTALPVSFLIYANPVLFTPSRPTFNRSHEEAQSNATFEERIISQVIGGTISGSRLESSQEWPLNSTVKTKFLTKKVLAEDEVVEVQRCVHWSYDDNTKEGYWSMEGCKGSPDDQGRTVCSCKRLASFAILVRVRKGSYNDEVALYFITLIGSTISSICLCMCLITFVAVRSYRTKQPTQIHFNLCLSLLGFYLAFLLSPLGTGNVIRCSVASAFIHFFCLATVAWMTAEAVNMYFLFVRMKRNAIRYFVPVSCLLAYGLPAICAVVVAVLDRNSNLPNANYCFIHPGPALYFGFLTEVAVMLVVNLVIFALISRKALCRPLMASKARENARRDEIIKRVRHCVLFWFILGLSWIFGALAILDGSTLIFDYLYSICISLQGLIMFLLLCVANPEFRKVFANRMQRVNTTITRSRSTGASTSTSAGDTSFMKPATISGSKRGLQ